MNILNELHQAADLIKKAKNIVLMPHSKMDCDGMSASIGLFLLLKKLGKNPTAVCADPVPESFSFLPSTHVFKDLIPNGNANENKFLVTVDIKEKGFKNLEYTIENGKVNILMFSDSAPFEENDFSFIGSEMSPDLIITLDSGDTKQLGTMYTDNISLFESIPVINIDHHVSNTQFGDVNLVDFKSCSTTELVYRLIPLLSENSNLLDENIATLLLAGMLTDTGSFQHSNTTPASLDIAAELIEKGARHQEIIKHLFKTKSLATLRIWGRILTKLQNDPIYRIVWSSVSKNDLDETLSHSDETEGLIDELMATTPGTELVLLVKEREDNIISTSVRSTGPEIDSVEFTALFGGGGHKQAAGFKIRERGGKSFEEIVSDIIFEAKKFQSKRLNIPMPKRDLISLLQPNIESLEKENKEDQEKENKEENSDNLLPPLPESLVPLSYKDGNEDSLTDYKKENTQDHNEENNNERKKTEEDGQNLDTTEGVENFGNLKNKKDQELSSLTETKEETSNNDGEIKETEFENLDSIDPLLSPEEQSYLNSPEYKIPDPEKEIEKQEDGEYIDDLAAFLSKGEEDTFIEDSSLASSFSENKNIEKQKRNEEVAVFDDFSSDMPKDQNLLHSISPTHTETMRENPLPPEPVNGGHFNSFSPNENPQLLGNPPIQNVSGDVQQIPQENFQQNNQFQNVNQHFQQQDPSLQIPVNDPFLQTLKNNT